eukprot:scaffold1410_cov154-Amphora_coffeaeformis.AAC.8
MVAWWKPVLAVVASIGTLHAVMQARKEQINLFFMKFFRDLGRYKALKRRLNNDVESKGLLAFLASEEDPLQQLLMLEAEQEDELHLEVYTRDELYKFGNHQSEDGTILLAILGRVYDVTEGDKFYGEGANYGHFAGHDVTYALATGCKSVECVATDWTQLPKHDGDSSQTSVFSDTELLEAKKWLSFFHLHDKYSLVGKLEGDSFDELVKQLLSEEEAANNNKNSGVSEEEMLAGKDTSAQAA